MTGVLQILFIKFKYTISVFQRIRYDIANVDSITNNTYMTTQWCKLNVGPRPAKEEST